METEAVEALNKLADYFEKCAAELEPWRKRSMSGPKVIGAQIDIWLDASEVARNYAKRKASEAKPGAIASIPHNNELEDEAGYDSNRSNVW